MLILKTIYLLSAAAVAFGLIRQARVENSVWILLFVPVLAYLLIFTFWLHIPSFAIFGVSSAESRSTTVALFATFSSLFWAYSLSQFAQILVTKVEKVLGAGTRFNWGILALRFILVVVAALSVVMATASAKTALYHLGIGKYKPSLQLEELFHAEQDLRRTRVKQKLSTCEKLDSLIKDRKTQRLREHWSIWTIFAAVLGGHEVTRFENLPSLRLDTPPLPSAGDPQQFAMLIFEVPGEPNCEILVPAELVSKLRPRPIKQTVGIFSEIVKSKIYQLKDAVLNPDEPHLFVYMFAMSDLAQFVGISKLSLDPIDQAAEFVTYMAAIASLVISGHVLYLVSLRTQRKL